MVSAYVESPTFGGNSWLAHISLLSGFGIRDEDANVLPMAQKRDTLVTAFARRGYRTVAMMSGLQQSWPEGVFYGFDVIYDGERLRYRGPPFGWWTIPDQFAAARMDAAEVAPVDRPARAPVFVFFPTTGTHTLFHTDGALPARLAAHVDGPSVRTGRRRSRLVAGTGLAAPARATCALAATSHVASGGFLRRQIATSSRS